MRFILIISLILLLLNVFNNPFPQFSEKELQFICQEEGL
jgi:hypothetical protein